MQAFQVHPDDGTISVHQDRMNPAEVRNLIRELEGNLMILSQGFRDPIQVMTESVRLDRSEKKISFFLSWNSPEISFLANKKDLPEPNVPLNKSQKEKYFSLLNAMIKGV